MTINWIEYSWENRHSHPPTGGRYLIYRAKCDKMHFEQWNGSGWSSSNNDCTHWANPQTPTMTKKQHGSLVFLMSIQTAILIVILAEMIFK